MPELPATLRKISPSSWLLISNTISSLFPTLLNTLQDPLHSIVPLHSCTYIPILYCQSWALFSTSKHPPRLLCFFCGLGSEHGGLCRLFSQKCTSWDDRFGSSARLLNAIKIIFPRKGGNPNQEHDYQCDAALSSPQEIEKAIRHVAFCLSLSKSRILFSACCVQKMSLSIGNFYVTNPYVPVQCPVFLFILSCRRRVSQKAVSMSQTHTVCAYAASKRTVPRQCPPFSSFFFPTQESKTSTSVFLQKAWLNDYVLSSSLCLGCWATKGLSACSDNPALLKINPL